MAPWIKMIVDLHDDAKVRMIARRTNIDDLFAVVGRLHRIWGWADRQTVDGRIKSAEKEDIDDLVQTPGFAEAMCEAGWLEPMTAGIKFPHFTRHNGQSAKRRAQDSARKARSRASNARPRNVRNPTGQSADQRRVDKSRGEKSACNSRMVSNSELNQHATHGADACSKAPVPVDHACVACRFPGELLRVADAINESPISARRRGSIIDAAKVIAQTRNPMPVWTAIRKRSEGKRNPGGYIANAMAHEAKVPA